jgi:phage I-like protein
MSERRVHFSDTTAAGDGGALRPDGTLWSHAVTPGTYVKGEEFEIGAAELTSFVANFNKGYPGKVPVDYEHGTTNGSTSMGMAVPKAGDVVEMHAVLSEADITPDIQASIDRTRQEWAALGYKRDINPMGLWVRWRPTPKAHQMLKAREYTEMSIAFAMDYAHNATGEGQGPTIKAIALTNRPFVDSMASIAASADTTGAAPRQTEQRTMKLFSAFSARAGKPITTEDEAAVELTALGNRLTSAETDLAAANTFRDAIAAEFGGEKDPTKLVAQIRNLNGKVTELTSANAASRDKEISAVVELELQRHEKKLTVPTKKLFGDQLAAELKAGKTLADTDTVKALGSLPALNITDPQSTNASVDGKGITDDVALASRITELSANDPIISKVKDPNARLLQAVSKARAEQLAKK